jgi:hypothetical protein
MTRQGFSVTPGDSVNLQQALNASDGRGLVRQGLTTLDHDGGGKAMPILVSVKTALTADL